jgi:SAM-dependent methyltransferase
VKNLATSLPFYLPYSGNRRFCPICGKGSKRFRPFGLDVRDEAQCFHCGSLERHRFLWLYLTSKTDLFDGKRKRMLHVAPEPCFEPRFRDRIGAGYLTADLFAQHVMIKMDITRIEYPDEWFDVIYCSHVLEHVEDDRKAMREFHRVLKQNGWAILLVPITLEKTFEDPKITDPLKRLESFGQQDHVRRYGRDYVDRLREAGFNVDVTKVSDLVPAQTDAIRLGLVSCSGNEIFLCRKSSAAQLGPSCPAVTTSKLN